MNQETHASTEDPPIDLPTQEDEHGGTEKSPRALQVDRLIWLATAITKEDKLRWERTRFSNRFNTNINRCHIVVSKHGANISLNIVDEKGERIADSWDSDSDIHREALNELWTTARENALKADQRLERLVDEMNHIGDPQMHDPQTTEPATSIEAHQEKKGLLARLLCRNEPAQRPEATVRERSPQR